jgi:hypothetical protein
MQQIHSSKADSFSGSYEIPLCNWVRRLITAFTRARHLSVFWSTSIQSMLPTPLCFLKFRFNPFQSNFSATRILPSSYLFWAGKKLVGYL